MRPLSKHCFENKHGRLEIAVITLKTEKTSDL